MTPLSISFAMRDRLEEQAQRVARIRARRAKLAADRLPTVLNDGGRESAGYGPAKRDCVTRAIALASGRPYAEVWHDLKPFACKRGNPDTGCFSYSDAFKAYMASQGFTYTSCLSPRRRAGRVKLRYGDLPSRGRLVVMTRGHAQAVIDGVVHDTHATASASVRGYWRLETRP